MEAHAGMGRYSRANVILRTHCAFRLTVCLAANWFLVLDLLERENNTGSL